MNTDRVCLFETHTDSVSIDSIKTQIVSCVFDKNIYGVFISRQICVYIYIIVFTCIYINTSTPKRNAGAAVLRAEPASKGFGARERVQAPGEAGLVAARRGTCAGTFKQSDESLQYVRIVRRIATLRSNNKTNCYGTFEQLDESSRYVRIVRRIHGTFEQSNDSFKLPEKLVWWLCVAGLAQVRSNSWTKYCGTFQQLDQFTVRSNKRIYGTFE